METVTQFLGSFNWEILIRTGLRILLILVLAWCVLIAVRKVLERIEDRLLKKSSAEGEPPSESAKRVETLIRLVRQAVHLVLWLVVGLVVLQELGVDIGPILAGAGILGLAVGFGAQNLVRDVISGFFIILENQVRVGDVAVINGTGGLVEKINFRTIVLRDLQGTVHVFPNGTITTLSNMTQEWSAYVFEVGVAYKENTDSVVEVIREVLAGMRDDETHGPAIIEDPEIFGVDALGDSAVVIKGRIKTRPIRQWAVGREFLRRIKLAFDERGIEIPFPHRSLYIGEATKPLAVEILERAGSGREA
jgi:small conductance mechanosensitive channel